MTDEQQMADAFRQILSAAQKINVILGRDDALNENVPEQWPLNLSADEFAAECWVMAEYYERLEPISKSPTAVDPL